MNNFSDYLKGIQTSQKGEAANTSALSSQTEESQKKKQDRVNPYGSELLNNKYKKTVLALYNIQQKTGAPGDLLSDAKKITDEYAKTVSASYSLFGGRKEKDYLSIAEKSFQDKLQDLVYKYQYGAQTEDQLKQSLLDTGFQGPKQIAAQNQQNVIDRAAAYLGGSLTKEQQALVDGLSRLAQIGENVYSNGALGLNWDDAALWQYAMQQPGTEWMGTGSATPQQYQAWAEQEAQRIREQYSLNYEDADKALEALPGYTFAREHQGDLTPYMAAARNASALLEKAARVGFEGLTEQEQEALWQAAARDEGGLDALALAEMDKDQFAMAVKDAKSRGVDLNALGTQWADELNGVNGIFSTYAPTKQQQAILDFYRQTPGGAQAYVDEAEGTKEEQKARDNFFFVTERDKFNAYEQREDFNPNTPINEKFMNDPVYAAVSGRPSSSILGTLGQTTFQAFTDVNYMTPEEKGKYRWYYENVNPKTAQEYYHLLSYELAERREALQEAGTKATVRSDPGNALAMEAFSFLENIPGGIFGTADLYGQMLKQATGELTGPVNYHSPWQGLNNQAETIRTETTAEIQAAMRNAGASDWLIQTVTMLKNGFEGAGDSLLSAYVGGFFGGTETGAKLLTNLIVSSRSALESMQSIHDRNGSDEQAAIGGIASGVAEWFFEQFSIEQLFSDAKRIGKQGFSDWVKSMLKEMGVNAQQEGFTSIADSIADVLIMGDESEYALSRDEYERLGMSPEDAEARAKQDLAEKAGQEALGGLIMGGIVGAGANVSSAINTAAENRATGEQILEKGWGEALGSAAEEYGIKSKAAQKLSAIDKESVHAGKIARAAGEVYRDWVSRQSGNTQKSREALDAAKDMLTHNFGETAKTGTDAQNAVDAGKKLARTARISEDGQTRLQPKEGEETGKAVELVGLDVAKDVIKVKIREDGEVKSVPFEEVSFPDAETADKAAVAAMAGGEKLGNALFNAQEPGTGVSFADYAKDFVRAYDAAQTGLSIGGIKAAGIGKNLTDGEIKTAHALGQRDKYTGDLMAELRDRAMAYLKEKIRPTVKEADVEAVADALLAQAEGEELTEEQAEALGQYEDNVDVQQAAEALEEAKTPEFGAANAYQLGLSGRRFEEVESTLQELGYEMTDEIRAEFERGQSELAERETKRINVVKALNAGEDGTRVGVLRSINPKEAEAAGVGIVSAEYFKQARDAVTALRGLAEATGVNMVLFESPVKEGTHVGANGWYDLDTRTAYLDIYAGKGNEKAMLRAAAHELTHFIKDWSPANYKKLRDFLLDYYYQTKDTVKKLVQEQMDKDKTLTEAEAMEEVIADASEMMLDGDKDAAAALGEQHPRLFTRIKGWIDTWAKALTRAWRSILPSNAASKLLKASAEHFQAAQKIWWEALEEASVNNRGEIRAAEIEEERETRLKELRAKLDAYKQTAEKRRQEAIDRANAAQTAEEGRQAIEDAQAARDLLNAQEAQEKEEEKKVNQEAKEKQAAADKITKAGQRIAEKLKKLPEAAQAFFRDFAERNGIAIDGSAKSGTALMKEAMHYFNQGKAGLPFNANTEAGQGAYAEMAEKMNALGQEEHNRAQLEAMAEETENVQEAEQNAQVTAENEQEAEENAQEAEEREAEQTTEEETVAALEAMAEGEQRAEATKEEPEEEFLDFDVQKIRRRLAEAEALREQGIDPVQDMVDFAYELNQAMEEQMAEAEATPEEAQAMETHTETVQKMADVLKGMTKKARDLVMKWGANEWVNVKMEDGSAEGIAFAQYAAKWYNAGKEGTHYIHVPVTEADEEYPAFLTNTFYDQGKADAAAAEKRQKAKEAKKNEKPVDKGAEAGTDDRGNQAGRLLEGVPAEDVQTNGGERGIVSGAEKPGRTNVGNDAEPDGSGPVRERGEGVSERDHVRHEAGEVTEEAGTPEQEQARETEEAVRKTVEETKTYLDAKTPKGTNYVIGDRLNIAKSTSEKARYQANVEAIRLLKKLEAENRYATPEEQEILSRYVGWGGLKNAFSDTEPKWKKEYAELAELLTPEEYRAANASVLNAHYTSIEVIRAMYEGLRHLGFQGGRMLEPSGGIGHFIGAMPVDMQQSVTSWTMVELDSITGRIAQKLYPLADVRIQGFQEAEIGNGIMDVAIGNVPFGDYQIVDKDYPKVKEYIHNYFFVKSIDKVRPGGLMMFITSHGTMDSRETAVRSILAKKADLLGAVRMPNTAFKGNANTEVVTDILIFRRRADGTPYKGEKFEEIRWMRTENGQYAPVSEYFLNHPDMILGKTTMQGSMYRGQGQEMTVEALPGSIGKQIVEAMNKIKGKMDYSQRLTVEQVQAAAAKARKQTKKHGYEVRDGKLYQRTEQGTAPVEMEKDDANRLMGALGIRDTARELQELQKRGASEQEKQAQREKLNRQYDDYVKQYGPLHNQKNQKLILEDPDGYFMLSLENWDKKKKTAAKADIFTQDTIAPVVTATHAGTPVDAVAIVINEKGYIDLARAAALLGVTEDAARDAILESESAYLNEKGALEPVATYLSGDTRAKLRMARQLATVDKRYERNVKALEKIIPQDVKREQIKLRPGMTWIPNAVYEQFICEILGKANTQWKKHVKVAYDPYSGKYTIEADDVAKYSYANTDEWGTKDYTFLGILDNIMNSKEGKVKYKDDNGKTHTDADATKAVEEQAKKIIAKFQEWLWQNENRAQSLETMYNDLYNTLVTPKYNGDSLTIAGANAGKQLRPHQRNMVQRIVQGGGNVLIAHCVGAGKTAEMAGAAMKLRQLGIVNKPVFVVPKALVGQWASEFLDFFPAAKVMALGENDFTPKNRKEFANRITTGDYDAVIMSYDQFKYIQMTPENQRAFYQNQIDQITEAIEEGRTQRGGKPLSVRELESTKKKLEAKLDKLKDTKKDDAGIYFEDMGIDSLFVDEAHYYKKLFFKSSMGRIKGVGDGSGNPTTYDMYQKIKWLQKMNSGRGIVFATATPVMNSMSETYNMQRYLQEDKLEQIGIRSFDAWAAMFGEVVTKVEPGVTGKMEEKKLFAKFKNMPELQKLIQSFMDVLTVDDLKETMRAYGQELKIPKMKGGKRIVVHSERSPFQTEYLKKLGERADKVKGSFSPKKGEDNMAVISMDGRKMSYTQHMIDPKLPYEEGCKVIKCVDNVTKIWKESADSKGTQIIFLDMGVPKGGTQAETEAEPGTETEEEGTAIEETKEAVDFYNDMKRMMIAKGVPAEQIAFISDPGNNQKKKLELYKKVKEGQVRILIGSTGKMGVGMNAQDRVVALHHLDAPWRPGDIEQREGRALRQGNINDEVAVYVYVTDDTFDTYMWQTLEWKAGVTHNVMNGSNTAREIDGDSPLELSFAEIKAVSQSNPLIKEQFVVGNQIRELEGLEREHNKERRRARESIAENKINIENRKLLIPKAEADAKTAKAALDGAFVMKVDGKRYTERAKAAAAMMDMLNKHKGITAEKKVGEFGGFTLAADGRGNILIKGQSEYKSEINYDSDTGTMTRLMNRVKDITALAENMRASIARMEEENRKSEQRASQPFDRTAELEKLRERKAEIDEQLNPVQNETAEETEEETPEKPAEKKASTRDPEDLSNRQLLARAYEGILADEKDRKYLEKYKEVIAQLDADTEEVRKLKREYHDKTFVRGQVDKEGAAKARAKYLALEEKITKADETLLRLERSEPLKKALEFEKKEAKRKAEEKAANTVKNYYEGVNRREYAIRIKKTAERLGQWLDQPDAKRHVPKAAQQAVADFLLTITQSRMAEFKGQGGTRRERNFVESMRRLKDFVEDVSAYKLATAEERVEADYKEFIDLPNGFKEQLAALIESVEKTIGTAGRANVVDEMTSEQMKELYKVMCTISTSITKINDFLTESAFRHVDQAAQNTMNFIRQQGRVDYLGSGRAHNFMNWENTQPVRAFERFGGGGMAVWDGLRRGQAQLAFNLQEIIKETDPANGYATPQEIKKWRETVKVFRMGDRLVPMTAAQAIDVYNLIKRGQAVGHIFGEGIRIADFKTQKGKLIRDKGGKITPEEAAAIAAYVESNPRMKQVADKMQKFVAQYGKRKGNPVNMKRFGYEFMNEENYWPIESDRDFLQAKTDNSKGNELYRLLNISSVKPLTEGARNRIMVRDAFDVFTQNLIDMAQYGALALPVLDAVKWVNYREKWEETREDGSRKIVYGDGIHSTARDQYGNQAYRYLVELLKDIQGVQATGDWGEDFSRKMLQRYNRAAIAANLSVAAKQPMSITRAAMELGSIDLITGAVKNIGQYKQNLGTMLKYSGIAVWKIEMGFYDVNVSRSAKRLILRDDSAMDKAMNATTALNEKADTVTWAAIWGACESWVRKQGGSYNSTDEFYKAVAEKFDDVIYKTQVVDSILTRSQFMRGTSFMNKWFSSFMSEPTTSYNMVLDAWWKFRNDMRRGLSFGQAFAENRTRILRTTAVYMVSAAVMTLLEALIGAWRDDDDYETFVEKFNAGLLNNAIDEFNILNNLPIVRDAMDFVKQGLADYVFPDEWNVYATAGGNNPVFSGAETLMGAADVWDKILSGNSNYTVYGAVYKTASAFSQLSGVPVAPAMREVVALWNNVMAYQNPEMRIETYESTASQGAAALYRAIQAGDEDRERTVRGQLAANNVDDKKLETALKSLMKQDVASGKLTEAEAQKYLQDLTALGKNDAYFKVQEWMYETENEDNYSRFDKLTEAITKGTGIDEAVKELTSHGYKAKDVQTKVRAIISEQTGKTKTMPVTRAVTLLEKYGGMTEDEAWIRGQELNYQRLTGDATTADSAMVIYAIEQKKSPKEAIDGLLAHGKKKEDIASAITSKYKQTYLELRTTNVSKAATLKGQLISIYEYLGYDGKKKVEDWEKKAK